MNLCCCCYGPFSKSPLNLPQYCLLVFFFFGCQTCGVLAPWPGIEPASLGTGSWSSSPGPPGKSLELFRRQKTECLERGAWWDVHADLCLLQYLEDFPFSEIWASSFVCTHHHPVHSFCLSSSWAFFFFLFSSVLSSSFHFQNYPATRKITWSLRTVSGCAGSFPTRRPQSHVSNRRVYWEAVKIFLLPAGCENKVSGIKLAGSGMCRMPHTPRSYEALVHSKSTISYKMLKSRNPDFFFPPFFPH